MRLEPMTIKTVPQVVALEAESFSTPWSETSILGELENPWAIWLVALDGETVAGYLGIQYGPDGGDIMTIATAAAYRGRGVARTLISQGIEQLREKGLGYLTLEVRPSNTAAVGLYTALDFQPVGRRPRYYTKPTEDALLMTRFFEEENKSC